MSDLNKILTEKYTKEGHDLYYKKVIAFIDDISVTFGIDLTRNDKETCLAPLFNVRWQNTSKEIADFVSKSYTEKRIKEFIKSVEELQIIVKGE